MYCPECGHDAANAKYCPECGADLGALRGALKAAKSAGKGAGSGAPVPGATGKGGAQRAGAGRGADAPAPSGGLSPRIVWAAIAVIAVAIVVGVAILGGDEQTTAGPSSGAPQSGDGMSSGGATPVEADTTGSYRELVSRAHDLYDEGDRLFAAQDIEQGAQYFAAAAKVYAAAWEKQPGDPNVGTDWATSLFYSGDFDGAIKQVNVVLKKDPDFQAGWFNLGNYLTHQGRMAEAGGDPQEVERLYSKAAEAYTKAALIDPGSATGVEAAARAAEFEE
jgi:hypothetical protein